MDRVEFLTASIEFAIEDFVEIAKHTPTEDMPKEEQLRCAMFSFFKQRGYLQTRFANEVATIRRRTDERNA